MRIFMAVSAVLLAVTVAGFMWSQERISAAESGGLDSMTKPEYDPRGRLIRPEGYRKWVFVGSSLGLSYAGDEPAPSEQIFHHIYIQPEAYDHYVETGTFPEKTMLVMENYTAGNKENNTAKGKVEGKEEFGTLNGHFEDARTGIEVALKDSDTFEEGWAYFNFTNFGDRTKLMDKAKAFNKSMCWDCHNTHAADDNVFIQFYPVLREHYEARQK